VHAVRVLNLGLHLRLYAVKIRAADGAYCGESFLVLKITTTLVTQLGMWLGLDEPLTHHHHQTSSGEEDGRWKRPFLASSNVIVFSHLSYATILYFDYPNNSFQDDSQPCVYLTYRW